MTKKELLTEREIQVIKLICKGYENHEIADKLKLSKKTVESHRYRIMKRLKLKNMAKLIIFAIKNNIYTI